MNTSTYRLSDEQIYGLHPGQICQRAGYGTVNRGSATAFVSAMQASYIRCNRPDARVLAESTASMMPNVHDVAKVLDAFTGDWWGELVCELLDPDRPPEKTEADYARPLMIALQEVALKLARAILWFDGRQIDGSDAQLPFVPWTRPGDELTSVTSDSARPSALTGSGPSITVTVTIALPTERTGT